MSQQQAQQTEKERLKAKQVVYQAFRRQVAKTMWARYCQCMGVSSRRRMRDNTICQIIATDLLMGTTPDGWEIRSDHEQAILNAYMRGYPEQFRPREPRPVACRPGTVEKVEAMVQRVERGEELFHERDGVDDGTGWEWTENAANVAAY